MCAISVAFVFCRLLQVGHYHHPLPKIELEEVDMMEADEPDHRTAPVYLRPMMSHTQWHHMSQSRAVGAAGQDTVCSVVSSIEGHGSGIKMNKSVSFAKMESILGGEWCWHLVKYEEMDCAWLVM